MSDDDKKKKAPPRRKSRLVWLMIGGFLVMQWFCWGIYINLAPVHPIDELRTARATWDAQKLDDYMMRLRVGNYCNMISLRFTIEDNQIIKIEESYDYNFEARVTPVPLDSEKSKRGWYRCGSGGFYPDTADFTMNNLFNIATEQLKDVPAPQPISLCGKDDRYVNGNRFEVSYHATEGYITSMHSTCFSEWHIGFGFMCSPTMGECSYGLGTVTIEPISTSEK
jgi:hypothetical protein